MGETIVKPDWSKCPNCGLNCEDNEDKFECETIHIHLEEGLGVQPVRCLSCGASWNNIYTLTAVIMD